MPLWYHNGEKYKTIDLAFLRLDKALLVGSGPSLEQFDPRSIDRNNVFMVGVNRAAMKFVPDITMMLDAPKYWQPPEEIWANGSFKVLRGNMKDEKVNGVPVHKKPRVLLADVNNDKPSNVFGRNGDVIFGWGERNTFLCGLGFLAWAGAKSIGLVGCDLGGGKAHFNVSTPVCQKDKKMHQQLNEGIKEFSIAAKANGLEVVSCTPESPINEYLEYRPINDWS